MLYNLRTAIIEAYGTQLALAEAAGIHAGRLNKIINGHVEATAVEREKLAELLNVEIGWLFVRGVRLPRARASEPLALDGTPGVLDAR